LIENPADPLSQWLRQDLRDREAYLEVVREYRCIAANARKIRSFANILARFDVNLGVGEADSGEYDLKLVVLMACLYHDHHNLYRMIEGDEKFYDLIYRWATGLTTSDAEKQQPHESLCTLRLPTRFGLPDDKAQKAATPEPTPYASYPDPVRGSVFRLQSLVTKIGPERKSELRRYLLSGKTRGEEVQPENE
jgi:hypothetical protein